MTVSTITTLPCIAGGRLADGERFALRRLAGLLEQGTVAIPIQQTYPVTAAAAANALAARHTQGKIAISIA